MLIILVERDESIDVVDRAVVDGAVNYVRSKQNSNGAFPVVGRVHNYRLLVSAFLVQFTLL